MIKLGTAIPYLKEIWKISVEKGLKLKVRRFLGLILTFVEVAMKKLVKWGLCVCVCVCVGGGGGGGGGGAFWVFEIYLLKYD